MEYVPSEEERKKAYERIEKFIKILEKGLEEHGIKADVFLGGSFGKDTWLPGTSDVDIFVRFDLKYKGQNISNILEEVIKKCFEKYIKIKGSRYYFKVPFEGFEFEVVPILRISKREEAENITDLSPFHVEYVKRKIEENPELKNEIRKAKYWFKKIGIYGAESYIRGFSGYATELLIIYYKSFENLINDARKWKPKVIIDIEGYYKSKEEIFEKLGKDKTASPIIIIDPVDPLRNASASVSYKSFAKLILFAKGYQYKKVEKEKGCSVFELKLRGKSENKDVAYTKVLKFAEFFVNQIERFGFKLLDWDLEFGEPCILRIYYYPEVLPEYEKHYGPPVWVEKHSDNFIQKWKDYEIKVEEDGRLVAIRPRKIRTINDLVEFLQKNYKEKFEDVIIEK